MSAPDTMLALVYDMAKDDWATTKGFRKEQVPRPRLDEARDPEDTSCVIVKVLYAGVCGSDRSFWHRQSFREMVLGSLRAEGKTWRVTGHEMVGEVVEIGSYARSHYGYAPGDVVAAESHIICGRCYQCRMGDTHVCSDDRIIGFSRDGCFAEFIKLPARVLWPTDPKRIRLEVAAIQEPFGNAVHACTKVDMRGRTVAVLGCGPIGLFTILIARNLGAARVLGVEPDPRRREIARQLGADEVFAPRPAAGAPQWSGDREVTDAIRKATGGVGADIAVEMAGYNSSVNTAIQSTRRGGDVVLFGLKSGDFTLQNFDRMIVNGIALHSVIGRQIFKTWFVTKGLLEDRTNGIQTKIFELILGSARESLVEAAAFEPARFEKTMEAHPKILLRF